MKTMLVLTIQRTVESEDEDSYEAYRYRVVRELEQRGWNVDVTAEEPDDE